MPSESILSHFWELASNDEKTRLKAASQLLHALNQAQKQHDERRKIDENGMETEEDSSCDELEYSVTRLVKGLASSRKGARQGFATVLTEVLSEFASFSPEGMLRLITKTLEITGSSKAWEERDCYIGQIFGMMSVLRSQCEQGKISSPDTEWLGLLITRIIELSKKKSYLQELCAKVIVDIFPLVSIDVFIKSVYPSVKEIVESGWTQATPETLFISLALQRYWGDHLDKAAIKDAWKCPLIADKQNFKEMGTVLQDSISSHPRVHCVWDEVFATLIGNSASDFELFWNIVVEDGLFQSTHDRKSLGFQLVRKVLPQIGVKQVSVLFGGHMMRSFINSLSSSQRYLHEAGKQLASSLPSLVTENADPEVTAMVLKQLLGRQGNLHFDKLTKTKTVDNLLGTLKGSETKMFVTWLIEIFEHGFVEGATETDFSAKSQEATRIAILNQLYQLVKKKAASHEGDWAQEVLFFFLKHAYFQPVKPGLKVALSPSVRQICEQRFVSALKDLSSSKEMKPFELHSIVQRAKTLLQDEECEVASGLWTEEAEKAFKKAVKCIERIQKKRRKSEAPQHEDEVFELLFSHMALNLFTEPDQTIDILKELKACYERQKAKKEEDSDEEPHWVEVLTEVLLSLLTRPSSLFRHVVDQVFTIIAPHLTRNALTMILESLDPRKGTQGEALEIVDESGDDEDDEEMEDDEGEEKEESNGVGNQDKNDNDDDDDEEDSSSDDEQEEAVGVVDEAFRAEVQAALGSAVVDMENEESSSEDDLDDEAMMKLDDALAAVFKTQLQAKKDKNKKKDAMKIVLHFKLRVLDIIEIFIKKQASNPLVLELIDPLLDVAWSSLNSKDFHTLGERAQGLFQNKLCSSKELPPTSSINAKDVHGKIEHLIRKALTAPSIVIVSLVTRGCLYLVRVLRGSRAQQLTGKRKGKVREDEDTTKASLLNSKRLSAAFNKALEDFMLKRSTHLHPVLFTELIGRFPHLGWYLAPQLVNYLETAVNNFRKSQACLMLMQLMSQKTLEHSTHIKDIASSLQTTLNSLMTKGAESDSEMKVKHIREILKLATKLINEVKHTGQASTLLQTDQLKEVVTLIRESSLAKRSPDLKGVCNTILSNLSGSASLKEQKNKNSKRKRETHKDMEDERTSAENGTVSSQPSVEKNKKRKKKK